MKKIYENDSYIREAEAVVTSCTPDDKRFMITLDQSIFFPEEGGQYADTGCLCLPDGRQVALLDGKIRKGEIFYQVSEEIPAGTAVRCLLDWEQRYARMQQHTGEHILTGQIHNRYGYNNVGFHLSDDGPVTMDVSGPLTWEQAMEMETAANRIVYANLPVRALYPSREELAGLTYRSKIEIEGQVRLIAIGEIDNPVDLCACCAPHVARTGEVGIIKIISLQNYKGGVRLGILCGMRALLHYRTEWKRLMDLAKGLSTGVDQVAASVAALQEDLAETRGKLAERTEELIRRELEAFPDQEHALYFSNEPLPQSVAKNAYNEMTANHPGYSGLFLGNDADGYRYLAGSRTLDSRELGKRMKDEIGAKGGGSPEMIQGKTAASREAIEAFWKSL